MEYEQIVLCSSLLQTSMCVRVEVVAREERIQWKSRITDRDYFRAM